MVVAAYETYWAGGNAHTVRAYFKHDFPNFLAFMRRRCKAPTLLDVTRGAIGAWIDKLLGVYAQSTTMRMYDAIRGFCRWAAASYPGFVDPCFRWTPIHVDRPEPQRLSPEIVENLADAAFAMGKTPFLAWRNKLLVQGLALTGMREDEFRRSILLDYSPDWWTIRKIRGKGRHFRSMVVSPTLRETILAWLPLREERLCSLYRLYRGLGKAKANLPLLISGRKPREHTPEGYMIGHRTEWRIVHDAGVKIGLKVWPHLLRGEFAHNLMDVTKNAFLVAQALGHCDVRTTMRYAAATLDELRRAIR